MPLASITILLERDCADAFGDALIHTGALSVSVADADEGTAVEQALFGEPGADGGLWNRCELTALFPENVDSRQVMGQAAAMLDMAVPDFTCSIVEDQDWVKQNQSQFPPIMITPRMTIVPTWHIAANTSPDAINISLDPGAAFGTGSHPTTRLCLQWLETQVASGNRVLDYGTGSGILAIAAMKLGAAEACAVDIDVAAIVAARFNALQNQVSLRLATTDLPLDYVADITVANILANPLKILAPLLAGHTVTGGRLVLAGILDEQADDIIAIYRPYFDLAVWRQQDGWSAIAGIRL